MTSGLGSRRPSTSRNGMYSNLSLRSYGWRTIASYQSSKSTLKLPMDLLPRQYFTFFMHALLIWSRSDRESQYKYHFKKWKWKRNISTSKKEALCKIRNTRAEAGRSTQFEYHGKTVEEKKLRRHMKNNIRKGPAMLRPANDKMDWKILTGSTFKLGNSMCVDSS